MLTTYLRAHWSAPDHIHTIVTTRVGGCSIAPYGLHHAQLGGLNLGDHVGDNPHAVSHNRHLLAQHLPRPPRWLNQIHSNIVVNLDTLPASSLSITADATVSAQPNTVCAVLTADCLPVLFCDKKGRAVGAAHAGWRGLCNGILEACAQSHARAAQCPADSQLAWLGPAIGPQQFEVGEEVRQAFIDAAWPDEQAATKTAFQKHITSNQYWCDIYQLARIRLQRVGITQITGGDHCTVSNAASFYSYRRDGITGRMASLIWITPHTKQ
ncbi:MAG: peptidoglycan editing factor PgeF [Ottowia sp.]|nr:peptidoglycan editing factor PgeF [Ottowia sp.]